MSFKHVKEGDIVMRVLAGVIPMALIVSKVDEKLIHCGDWTFDRTTGAEVDEELGWGNAGTGSFLQTEQ